MNLVGLGSLIVLYSLIDSDRTALLLKLNSVQAKNIQNN